MSSKAAPPVPSTPSRHATWILRGAVLCVSAVVALVGADLILNAKEAGIRSSDRLEPGMIRFDARLGWSLVPEWSGRHRHRDFATAYRIGSDAFRRGSGEAALVTGPRSLVVGDSFTFGFGVDDNQTFVDRLDTARVGGHSYVNLGIPGYSTDQQLLLLKDRVPALRAARVVVMVYVGNDLFDNRLGWPLQANNAKPYFELRDGVLESKHLPVPRTLKPADARPAGLMEAVLGSDRSAWPLRYRLEARSELLRLALSPLKEPDLREWLKGVSGLAAGSGDRVPSAAGLGEAGEPPQPRSASAATPATPAIAEAAPPTRYREEQALYFALMDRVVALCAQHGIEPVICPLAGRSYVEEPDSLSGQFQEHFIEQVEWHARQEGVRYIPVAPLMRSRYREAPEPWYFPNEGHLNPRGHEIVAEILAGGLAEGYWPTKNTNDTKGSAGQE